MKDKMYPQLKQRLDEVYSVTPNDLHIPFVTAIFKLITGRLKFFPLRFIIPISIIATIILYIVGGYLLVRLVSILQYGF